MNATLVNMPFGQRVHERVQQVAGLSDFDDRLANGVGLEPLFSERGVAEVCCRIIRVAVFVHQLLHLDGRPCVEPDWQRPQQFADFRLCGAAKRTDQVNVNRDTRTLHAEHCPYEVVFQFAHDVQFFFADLLHLSEVKLHRGDAVTHSVFITERIGP